MEHLTEYITEEELLSDLGVTVNELNRMRYKFGLPYSRIGKSRRVYNRNEVQQWLNDRTKGRD